MSPTRSNTADSSNLTILLVTFRSVSTHPLAKLIQWRECVLRDEHSRPLTEETAVAAELVFCHAACTLLDVPRAVCTEGAAMSRIEELAWQGVSRQGEIECSPGHLSHMLGLSTLM